MYNKMNQWNNCSFPHMLYIMQIIMIHISSQCILVKVLRCVAQKHLYSQFLRLNQWRIT